MEVVFRVGDECELVRVFANLGLETWREVKLLRILGGGEDSIPTG